MAAPQVIAPAPLTPPRAKTSGWVVARRVLLVLLLLGAAWLLVMGVPGEVCRTEATDIGAVKVCAPMAATDMRVLLFLLVVALLLLPEVSELEFAGLVSLKRDVAKAQEGAADAKAAVEQLRIEVHQNQTQNVSVSVDARQAGTAAAVAEATGTTVVPPHTLRDEVSQLAYQAGILGLAELLPASGAQRVFIAATRDASGEFLAAQVVPADGEFATPLTWLNLQTASKQVRMEQLGDGSRYMAALAGDADVPLGALLVHVGGDVDADALAAFLELAADAYALLLQQLLGEHPQ